MQIVAAYTVGASAYIKGCNYKGASITSLTGSGGSVITIVPTEMETAIGRHSLFTMSVHVVA